MAAVSQQPALAAAAPGRCEALALKVSCYSVCVRRDFSVTEQGTCQRREISRLPHTPHTKLSGRLSSMHTPGQICSCTVRIDISRGSAQSQACPFTTPRREGWHPMAGSAPLISFFTKSCPITPQCALATVQVAAAVAQCVEDGIKARSGTHHPFMPPPSLCVPPLDSFITTRMPPSQPLHPPAGLITARMLLRRHTLNSPHPPACTQEAQLHDYNWEKGGWLPLAALLQVGHACVYSGVGKY